MPIESAIQNALGILPSQLGRNMLDAFKPNLRRAEAEVRIAMLTAKLKLLDGPPHTL
jgi:hypothetical protein